jgi:hypothetical protein
MKILTNLQKAHDLLDDCNAENDSGGCLFCSSYGYSQFGLIHHDNCLILRLRTLIDAEKAVLGVETRFEEPFYSLE